MSYIPPIQIKNADGTFSQGVDSPGTVYFTETPLGANGFFCTGWIKYRSFQSLSILSFIDVVGAPNSLKLEFSSDGGATIIETNQAQLTDLNIFRTSTFPIHRGNAIKITYTNGATPQTLFNFRVKLHNELMPQLASNFLKMRSTTIGVSTKTLLQLPDTNLVTGAYDFITRTGNSMNVNVTNSNPSSSFYMNEDVNETKTVKAGVGKLKRIVFNAPQLGTLTVYDGLDATGTKIAVVGLSNTIPFSLEYDLVFTTGLTYVSVSNIGTFTIIFE